MSLEQVIVDNDDCDKDFKGEHTGETDCDKDFKGEYTGETDSGKESRPNSVTDIRGGADDLGDVSVGDSGQFEDRTDQNDDVSEITDGGEEQMALQFVPDEDVGLLVPRMSSCNIEDLPNEVSEKNLKTRFDVISRSLCW